MAQTQTNKTKNVQQGLTDASGLGVGCGLRLNNESSVHGAICVCCAHSWPELGLWCSRGKVGVVGGSEAGAGGGYGQTAYGSPESP